MYYVGNVPFGLDDLQHYGIKGQKWGIRRYENEDGSLTPAGKERYRNGNDGRSHRSSSGPKAKGKQIKIPEKAKKVAKVVGGVAAGAVLVAAMGVAVSSLPMGTSTVGKFLTTRTLKTSLADVMLGISPQIATPNVLDVLANLIPKKVVETSMANILLGLPPKEKIVWDIMGKYPLR